MKPEKGNNFVPGCEYRVYKIKGQNRIELPHTARCVKTGKTAEFDIGGKRMLYLTEKSAGPATRVVDGQEIAVYVERDTAVLAASVKMSHPERIEYVYIDSDDLI